MRGKTRKKDYLISFIFCVFRVFGGLYYFLEFQQSRQDFISNRRYYNSKFANQL